MGSFRIQNQSFSAPLDPRENGGFVTRSVPRPYVVEFPQSTRPSESVAKLIGACRHPLLLVDGRVAQLHLDAEPSLASVPRFTIEANEESKNIQTVLKIIDFLETNRATRTSMLAVVGGGIVQDLGAFAGYLFKRGIPWTFVPTTLLAQGDSGMGGKTALNHKKTKNLLALFSAPRRVIIDTGFLDTLGDNDMLSGMGEVFRLHVTGGVDFLTAFEQEFPRFKEGSKDALLRLIIGALSVKRAVIERDEFEVDLRRSLNYGHSFGHALEALVDFRIPHGIAVTIGMLVENEVALRRGLLSKSERDRMLRAGRALVPAASRNELASVKLDGILELLRRDKKTEGSALKLVVVESIGQIRFIDLELDTPTVGLLHDSVAAVVHAL
ncbi:MAG: 3-dehydroquinate synthase [Betaproteobacteria bacterium]|nr:MAG: 3-dehydroquinate synthase [Betaproteobacteria bacterium]